MTKTEESSRYLAHWMKSDIINLYYLIYYLYPNDKCFEFSGPTFNLHTYLENNVICLFQYKYHNCFTYQECPCYFQLLLCTVQSLLLNTTK